jgi:hypothetical protein
MIITYHVNAEIGQAFGIYETPARNDMRSERQFHLRLLLVPAGRSHYKTSTRRD